MKAFQQYFAVVLFILRSSTKLFFGTCVKYGSLLVFGVKGFD